MIALQTGELQMRTDLFQPTIEGEARLLLLIDMFSSADNSLEGRTKLAKLDFFLRYPIYLKRALQVRGVEQEQQPKLDIYEDVEARMVRYRYGPWDPSYYAILGRLIGKGLVTSELLPKGIGYKTSDKGKALSKSLNTEPTWQDTIQKLKLLKKYLNLSGNRLKKFVYDNFPEVTKANWGQSI